MTPLWKSLLMLGSLLAILLLFAVVPANAQSSGSGFLKVKAKPGRAGVFVDGEYVGPAANLRMARKYTVAAGEHEVVLREPRYEDYTTTVTITAGKTTTISRALSRAPKPSPPFGRLRTVGWQKFTGAFVNGRYMGHADEFNAAGQGLLLNPGTYSLQMVSPGGDVLLERDINIEAKRVLVVRAR